MQRVSQLITAFEHIARTRMAGVPLLHSRLHAEAVGFQAQADDAGEAGVLGILLTPWFMNLVWLPGAAAEPLDVGASRLRHLGGAALSFIGAQESGCRFEACSLFSPMFEFRDQSAARAVAQAALVHLRRPAEAPASVAQASTSPIGDGVPVRSAPVEALPARRVAGPATSPGRAGQPPDPTRRGLLFGRRAAEAAR